MLSKIRVICLIFRKIDHGLASPFDAHGHCARAGLKPKGLKGTSLAVVGSRAHFLKSSEIFVFSSKSIVYDKDDVCRALDRGGRCLSSTAKLETAAQSLRFPLKPERKARSRSRFEHAGAASVTVPCLRGAHQELRPKAVVPLISEVESCQ